MTDHRHVPPANCPVCDAKLAVTRLGCETCGTELSGRFEACQYCALSTQDRRTLATFLVSRGNMKDLARELGVSYPTARARFAELLVKLGLEEGASAGLPHAAASASPDKVSDSAAVEPTEDLLRRLAAGEIGVDEAESQLPD